MSNILDSKNNPIITTILRLTLCLFFISGALAHLFTYHFFTANITDIKPWVTNLPYVGKLISVLFLIISIPLLLGFRMVHCSLIAAGLICINHILLLVQNPFYNTFHHSVPFFIISILLVFLSIKNKSDLIYDKDKALNQNSEKIYSLLFLLVRIFIGAVFLMQGGNSIFNSGVIKFAKVLYVDSYQNTFIPKELLWVAGVSNPFLEFFGGLFLIIGFKTRITSVILSVFLISIVFGHVMNDPFETSGDISSYGLNNLGFVILILLFNASYNFYSLDYLVNRNGGNGLNSRGTEFS
ncbi:hypothetical protein BH11BAC1_BH11BAC1_01850 [soil metagenome]